MSRIALAPCLFVCPRCGRKARATQSAIVKHRCPNHQGKVVAFRLTAEPDGCKVRV